MLGVNERGDFRRASLVSEIYSPETQQQSALKPVVKPKGGSKDAKPAPAVPKPQPYIPGMRRAVPKGKFGLIGLGKTNIINTGVLPLTLFFGTAEKTMLEGKTVLEEDFLSTIYYKNGTAESRRKKPC